MAVLPGDSANPLVVPQADRPIASYTGGIAEGAAQNIGTAFAGLGETVTKSAQSIMDTQDKIARANAEQTFLSKKLDLDEQFAKDPDYATAPQRYRAALTGVLNDTAQGIRGASQRADFSNGMARWVEYGTNTQLKESNAKWKDAGKGSTLEALDSAVNDALRSPDDATTGAIFDTVNQRLSAARDQGFISEAERRGYAKNVVAQYADKRGQMMLNTDPASAVKALAPNGASDDGTPTFDKAGDWRDYLDPAKRTQLYREGLQRVNEGSTVFRGSVDDRFRNNVAALYNTGQPAQSLTEDEIRTAYPAAKYGDKADHMIRQMYGAAQVGTATQSMALTSPEDDAASIARFEPKLGTPDYGDQVDRQNSIVTAYNNKYKALAKDPADYVLGASPQINDLNQKAMKDPTQMGAYVSALNAAYDKLGVPQSSRTIMPAGQAQQLAQSITADPENAPAKLKQMQQQTGPAWDDVWHTLTTAGKLPAAYQAVGTLDNERDAALLARWLGETQKGQKTADDFLGPKAVSDIKNDIRTNPAVIALGASLSKSGAPNTQVDAILGSIDTLAYAKKFYDQDPHASQSAIDSFTTKYEFMPNGGARVPSNLMPQVTANARGLLDTLDPSKVAVPNAYAQTDNFAQAKTDMNLTPQEQYLYQHHLDNLGGSGKVMQPNGSVSTILQAVVERDGKFVDIPTVWGGKVLSVPDAAKRAGAEGWDKWPSYATEDQADSRYMAMHSYMDRDVGAFLRPGAPKASEYTDLIKASPTWITSPRADALWLMDNGGKLVRDKKGAPLAVPFSAPPPAPNLTQAIPVAMP